MRTTTFGVWTIKPTNKVGKILLNYIVERHTVLATEELRTLYLLFLVKGGAIYTGQCSRCSMLKHPLTENSDAYIIRAKVFVMLSVLIL